MGTGCPHDCQLEAGDTIFSQINTVFHRQIFLKMAFATRPIIRPIFNRILEMKISYRLLKRLLPTAIPVENILNDLTMLGQEVEGFIDLGVLSKTIVVGKILSIKKHPDADKLSLCKVDVGEKEPLDIVCGASNINEGDVVPVALVGAELSNGMVIKKSKIRGEKSEGMMCSASEMGLGDDHSGIYTLPDDWKIGEPFDLIIDLSINANRGDCLSLLGIARELAAKYGKKVYPPTARVHEQMEIIDSSVSLSVKDKQKCPRYCARLISGVKIEESPLWLKRALEMQGLRPINNVVDVTNFVLMELGHPLHAFDYDKVKNHKVIVRTAKDGEEIETLDGRKHKLTKDDLLIADEEKPIAIAGVMGGANSEVDEKTANILLEAAYFDPVSIRKTSRKLDAQTDASYRFERGVDMNNIIPALNRAASLIKEISGGEIAKGIIDFSVTQDYPQPILLEIKHVNNLLGLNLNNREIADILLNLGFEISHSDKEKLHVVTPAFRNDISIDVDLIEEVARIYGYNNIPAVRPNILAQPPLENKMREIRNIVSNTLVSLGYYETANYSFISEQAMLELARGCSNFVKIMNPMSQDHNIMRPSLLPDLLKTVAFNHNRNNFDLRLFEIDRVFTPDEKEETHIREDIYVVAGISGSFKNTWNEKQECDFYTIKGATEQILKNLHISDYTIERSNKTYLHPGKSARFVNNGHTFAEIGELHPIMVEKYDLKRSVFLLEINLSSIKEDCLSKPVKFAELPKFPESTRDFAFVVDKEVSCEDIEKTISETAKQYIENIKLFDLYEGNKIPENKKGLAFSVTFRAADATLKDEEVNKMHQDIIAHVKEKLGAELR